MKKVFNLISERHVIIFIIILGVVIRLLFGLVYNPLGSKDNYWEYGHLAKNLKAGKGYSYLYFEGNEVKYEYQPDSRPIPSAYMPPGYVAFIYPFLYLENIEYRNFWIGNCQSLLYGIVILAIFLFSQILFNRDTAIVASIITAVLPEFIYLPFTIGPTVLFHLLLVFYFIVLHQKESNKKLLLSGVLSACLVYLRAEFLLFIIISTLWKIYHKQLQHAFIGLVIPLILLAPWSIRNYFIFNKFVPITTNGGLNFYRGHNPDPGGWVEGLYTIYPGLEKSNLYEVELNKVFFNKGLDFIFNNPSQDLINNLKKTITFWTIDPADERSSKILYWLPWLTILLFSLVGFVISYNKNKFAYEYLFFLYATLIVVLFFSQVRYQSLMKIVLIPFASYGIMFFLKRLKNKRIIVRN